jgi:hypothetical protein
MSIRTEAFMLTINPIGVNPTDIKQKEYATYNLGATKLLSCLEQILSCLLLMNASNGFLVGIEYNQYGHLKKSFIDWANSGPIPLKLSNQ